MVDSSRAWCQQHIVNLGHNLGLRVDQSARHIDWYTDFKKKKWFLFRGGYRSSEQNAILLNISMPIDKQKINKLKLQLYRSGWSTLDSARGTQSPLLGAFLAFHCIFMA